MNKNRDELIEALGMGISRRTMLKRMGYGAAGAIMAPSLIEDVLAQKRQKLRLSDSTPQPVWQYQVDDPATASPVLNNGALIFPTYDSFSDAGTISSVDTQTTKNIWSRVFPGTTFSRLLVANNVIYVTDQASQLYALDATTGTTLWTKNGYQITSQSILFAGGKIIFTTSNGFLRALDPQGNQVWSYQSELNVGLSDPVISGGRIMVLVNDIFIDAVDLETGNFVWRYEIGFQTTGGLTVGQGNVYVLSTGYFLNAIDIATGQLKWRWPDGGGDEELLSSVYYNGAVYVGTQAGNFYAVDAARATTLWRTQVQDRIDNSIFIEDGIAYFAGPGSGTLYAVDLASQGEDIVSYRTFWAPTIISIETGVCYFYDINQGLFQTNIGAVNLAGLIHQFFAESELIVEDYVQNTSTGAARGNSTSFRTHIQLFDPNKNPRVNKSIKVWASSAVTITSGGQTYNIDPINSAWLQTDAAGELSIASTASGITAPALYLWGNFMEVGEAMVVYPDHDTLGKLSNVQGADLQQATAYDGTTMLPSTYTQTDDLASTIRNTIGGTVAAMKQTQLRQKKSLMKKRRGQRKWRLSATPTSYLAYPESTTNLLYQPIAGPANRTYVRGAVTNWTAKFDASGGVVFGGGTLTEPQLPPGSIWGSFDDFVNDVVNGARQVGQIVWGVAQTIYNELGQAYQFVVQTIEQAAAVVVGILKTVVDDIKKAIEWLSYLFDWDDILAIKDQLKAAASGGFTNLKMWLNNQVTSDLATVHQFFQGIEGSIQTTLAQASALVGGSSLQSKQQNNNNPQALYGAGGAKSYTKSRWLMQKFQDNAAQATVSSSASPPGGSTDTILSAIEELIINIGSTISNSSQFQSIPTDIKNVFSDFSLLATNPSEFVTKSFGDIIQLISDILVSIVQLTDAIVEALIRALLQILDAIIHMVAQPLQIPVLSDLYSLITKGSQLSILDLCCLFVAVPTTIVQKAISSLAATDNSPAPGAVVLNENIGYLFAAACYVVLDPLMDVFEQPPPMKFVYMGLTVILQGLNFPVDLASNTTGDYVFYAATTIPIIMTGVDIRYSLTGGSATWELLAPTIDVFYGIIMLGASFVLGMSDPKFQGKDYLLMIQNIFTFLPFPFKPLTLGDEKTKIALGVIDGVSDLTAMLLAGAQDLLPGAATK